MKRYPLLRLLVCLSMLGMIGGCGGYAQSSNSSGVQVYGTVDASVSNVNR